MIIADIRPNISLRFVETLFVDMRPFGICAHEMRHFSRSNTIYMGFSPVDSSSFGFFSLRAIAVFSALPRLISD